MGLTVTKVQLHGASQRGIQLSVGRSSPGTLNQCLKDKSVKATVSLIHDGAPKTVDMRVDDMPAEMLGHTLLAGFDNQGFVQPRDMELVRQVIVNHPEVALRFVATQEAPIDWAKVPFDLNFPERTAMFVAEVQHSADEKGHTIRGDWAKQAPEPANQIYPFSDMLDSPAAQYKHYGQAYFDSMKGRRTADGKILGFRWWKNIARARQSARRTGLTPTPIDWTFEALRQTAIANQDTTPPAGSGAEEYYRLLHYGSGRRLGVKEAGRETFIIFASPVGPYYAKGEIKPIHITTPSSSIRRSADGLTGGEKVSANYVMGLIELILAKEKGFNEVLWIDTIKGRACPTELGPANMDIIAYPRESGSSNFFYVINNELYTPELGDTILPGVTRDSVIHLARALGLKVHEAEIPLQTILASGSETFCTGTAAGITPIGSITDEDQQRVFNNGKIGPITQLLYNALMAVQEVRFNDPSLRHIRPDKLQEFKEEWIIEITV